MNIHGQIYRVSTAAQQQVAALLHETDAKSSRLENSNNNI